MQTIVHLADSIAYDPFQSGQHFRLLAWHRTRWYASLFTLSPRLITRPPDARSTSYSDFTLDKFTYLID